MNKRNLVKLGNPNLPVMGSEFRTSGLPVPQYIDRTAVSQESMDTAGTVISTRDMFLPNFSFRAFEGTLFRDAILVNEENDGGELLGSCFFMESKLYSRMPGNNELIGTFNGSHNFKFDPDNEMMHFLPANSKLDFVHFSYKAEFLDQLLPDNEDWADDIRTHLVKRIPLIGRQSKHLSAGQERALQNIFDCPLQGKWAQMMIESSFAQLVLLQMQALFNSEKETMPTGFTQNDLHAMHALKEHLTKTFLEDHSMNGLARHLGINTNKLMIQFKKLFGKSVFEFLTDLRMEYAAMLLREENKMVIEVAHQIGYKNPNHFSSAFKRRFGIIPSEYRAA